MAHARIVEKLRAFTTQVLGPSCHSLVNLQGHSCDISDALCALKYRNGGFLSGLTMWSPERQSGPTKIVGPAYTVKYVPVTDAAPKLESHYVCNTEY
jgi:hypothetical protein